MKNELNKQGIDVHIFEFANVFLVINQTSNHLFKNFAQTPLSLKQISKSGYKKIVCLSDHDFSINTIKLQRSGMIARADQQSVHNVLQLLTQDQDIIVVVSTIAKKYFDQQTALQHYAPRIFCLVDKKRGGGIINKLFDPRRGVIYRAK